MNTITNVPNTRTSLNWITKKELIGKSYEDVEEQLSEIAECADLPKETIVQLLAGVDSDDVSSDNNQESDNGEVEGPERLFLVFQ